MFTKRFIFKHIYFFKCGVPTDFGNQIIDLIFSSTINFQISATLMLQLLLEDFTVEPKFGFTLTTHSRTILDRQIEVRRQKFLHRQCKSQETIYW